MFTRSQLLRTVLTVVCLVSVPFCVLAASSSVQVTVDKLNVRSGPTLNDQVVTTLPVKSILPVVSEKEDWIQVKLPNGQTGWVASWLVKPVTALDAGKQIESQVTDLNVRSGPSLTFPIIHTISPNVKYPLLEKSAQWLQIQLPNQQKGWVASWLVTESGGAKAPTPSPTVTPTPQVPVTQQPVPNVLGQTGQPSTDVTLTYAPYVYPEPDESIPAIGQLSPGDTVQTVGKTNGWLQIDYKGIKAWILSSDATDSPGPPQVSNPEPAKPVPTSNAGQQTTATVHSSNVNLRTEPNTNSSVLTLLAQDTQLIVLNKQGDWYQVKNPNGQTGWVAGWLINLKKPAEEVSSQASVAILNPDTNVRSGPGSSYDILGTVQTGERYQVIKQEDDWFEIKLKDGTTAYIAGWLVSAEGVSNVVKGNELVKKVIVVDAGHGGNDNGATGSSFSTLEKTINLQVSMLLRNKLEAAGATVIMTRTDDRKLTLQQRVDAAVQNKADIFVSIHHNTHPNTLTNGTIVFYYNQGNSSKLASLVQNEVVKATKYKDMQSRYGNYFVLRENPVVSILAEIGFLSNYNDEILLRSNKQQDLAAEGVFKGILQYFAATSVN